MIRLSACGLSNDNEIEVSTRNVRFGFDYVCDRASPLPSPSDSSPPEAFPPSSGSIELSPNMKSPVPHSQQRIASSTFSRPQNTQYFMVLPKLLHHLKARKFPPAGPCQTSILKDPDRNQAYTFDRSDRSKKNA